MTMHVELKALKRRLYIDSAVRNIKFFPGSELDASPEDFAREMNKYFVEAENMETAEDSIDVDC
jgi:hypothetical protein